MTFRHSATLGRFDDTPVVDFARDKELITCREPFYCMNGAHTPAWLGGAQHNAQSWRA